MTNNFEKLIIGSAHEGSEGMFEAQEWAHEEQAPDLAEARSERGIFSNAQQRFEQTIADHGYTQLRTLENGMTYPTVDQWIDHRLRHHRGTKFFPSFIQRENGGVAFCKVQLSENPEALAGLEQEAKRLGEIPKDVRVPKLIEYIPPQEGRAACLITESISIQEATVTPAGQWDVGHAQDAVRQIKILEETPLQEKQEVQDIAGNVRTLMTRAGTSIQAQLVPEIQHVLNAYEKTGVACTVHGDATLKNILTGGSPDGRKVYLVDWEFRGAGFVGQDAAKMWTGLRENPVVARAFAEGYVKNADGSINEKRRLGLLFGVIAENAAHLAWKHEHQSEGIHAHGEAEFQRQVLKNNEAIQEALLLVRQL